MSRYRKSLVAVLGVVLTGLSAVYGSDPWVQQVISVAVLLGVYQVRNEP